MQNNIPVMRQNDLVIQELDNEILIYDLQNNKVFALNETSALVWQFSNGEKTMSEIAEMTSKKLNAPITEEFVWIALEQLKKANLIENEIENNYQGSTRREIIKRVGLATMIALPMISTLIAPLALQAQSGGSCGTTPNIALGCSCVVGGLANSGNCASGCCDFINAGLPGNCVPAGGGLGSTCVRACQCASGCCGRTGFGCINPNSKPVGSPCVFNCECNCVGGICA